MAIWLAFWPPLQYLKSGQQQWTPLRCTPIYLAAISDVPCGSVSPRPALCLDSQILCGRTPHTPRQTLAVPSSKDLDDHMDGWSEVVAQLEHGMVSIDLPSLPLDADVPLVCRRSMCLRPISSLDHKTRQRQHASWPTS